jgi:hypothetical protein
MSKYITELANDIAKSCPDLVENGCGNDNCVGCLAFKLIGLGYQKQEWISVDERLPDEDGEYLTWNGLVYFLIYFNASLGLWNVTEGGDTSTAIRDVTHWMPLPEAPKMKGGAE